MNDPRDLIGFSAASARYDVDYIPGPTTRSTTNFANLARNPATRRRNIGTFLSLVNADLNRLLGCPGSSRYEIGLEVVTVAGAVAGHRDPTPLPLTEVLRASVRDRDTGALLPGPTGMNFSSYLRDHDFRVALPELLARSAGPEEMARFGQLHGLLCRMQFADDGVVPDTLVVAISVSQRCDYVATGTVHPVLGREYHAAAASITDSYFGHMGLQPRYFRPGGLPAPMAIYSDGGLLERDRAYLAALVAVMGNFQRIYRPEIYLSRRGFTEVPGEASRASLTNTDHEPPAIAYDRDERESLSDDQAAAIEERFLLPHADVIAQLTQVAERGWPPAATAGDC